MGSQLAIPHLDPALNFKHEMEMKSDEGVLVPEDPQDTETTTGNIVGDVEMEDADTEPQ